MPTLEEVRAAKTTFKSKFPNLMAGIIGSPADDGFVLTVRIPEGTTQEEHGIPDDIDGVPIVVKSVSYDIRKQKDEGASGNSSDDS